MKPLTIYSPASMRDYSSDCDLSAHMRVNNNGQWYAKDEADAVIRELEARVKELEQRVEDLGYEVIEASNSQCNCGV